VAHTKARAKRAREVWGDTPQERSIYQVTEQGGSYEPRNVRFTKLLSKEAHTKARAKRAREVWGDTPQERSIYQVTEQGGSYESLSEASPGGLGGYPPGTFDLPSY
jgi:hypothetical protein